MKAIYRYTLLLASFVMLGLTADAQRKAEIDHFPIYKRITDEGTYAEFITYIGGGETISLWKTLLYGDKGTSVLVKSSGDNPKVKEVKIKKDSPLRNADVVHTQVLGNQLLVAYESTNKKEEALELRLARVNTNSLEIESDEILMQVARFGPKAGERGYIKVGNSYDNKRLAVLGVDGVRDGSGSGARINTINLETDEASETELNFDQRYSVNLGMTRVLPLSNGGVALAFRIIYPKNERRVFKSTKQASPHEYLLKVYDASGKEMFSQMIQAEDRTITELCMGETNQGTLTIAGWLAQDGLDDVNETYGSTGAFSTSMSLSDYTLASVDVFDFGNDLLGRTNSSASKKFNDVKGYRGLTILDTHMGSDGALWFTAEEQYKMVTESNMGVSTTYYGVDILIARISAAGKIEWVSKLAAWAFDWNTKWSALIDDELYVVFSDNEKNEKVLGGGHSDSGKAGNMMLAVGHFTKSGDASKKHVYNYSKDKKRDYLGSYVGQIEGGIVCKVGYSGLNYVQEVKFK